MMYRVFFVSAIVSTAIARPAFDHREQALIAKVDALKDHHKSMPRKVAIAKKVGKKQDGTVSNPGGGANSPNSPADPGCVLSPGKTYFDCSTIDNSDVNASPDCRARCAELDKTVDNIATKLAGVLQACNNPDDRTDDPKALKCAKDKAQTNLDQYVSEANGYTAQMYNYSPCFDDWDTWMECFENVQKTDEVLLKKYNVAFDLANEWNHVLRDSKAKFDCVAEVTNYTGSDVKAHIGMCMVRQLAGGYHPIPGLN